jgi:inner membrane protein
MMSITHAAIALTVTTVALGSADPYVLTCAGLASQIPDLDSTTSIAGRSLYPIAWAIEQRFPHRTITHSFFSLAVVSIVAAPLALINWQWWAAVSIGQFMGWFSDAFTKSGVTAFWPNPARLVIPGNPRARLATSSPNEYWVLGIASILLICFMNIASAGGITEQFELAFFSNSATAADQFHKHGHNRVVTIDLEGTNTHTSQAVMGKFTVIEASTADVIAESGETGKLYKVGTSQDVQIRTTKLKTEVGNSVKITAHSTSLKEVSIGEWLQRVPQNAYITGNLRVEDLQETHVDAELETYQSVRLAGNQIELSNARPVQLEPLKELWILRGRVITKVRTT